MHVSPAQAQQPFVTTAGDLNSLAWWVVAEFHPSTTTIRGIPVSKIRSSWCKATEFRPELIPKELLSQHGAEEMKTYKLAFALEGNFGGSAAKQVALVGVYEECSGQIGRFVLVLDQPTHGPPKVRFVDALPTPHQFGILSLRKDNAIVVWSCLECDGFAVLKWDRRKRRFGWLHDAGQG